MLSHQLTEAGHAGQWVWVTMEPPLPRHMWETPRCQTLSGDPRASVSKSVSVGVCECVHLSVSVCEC